MLHRYAILATSIYVDTLASCFWITLDNALPLLTTGCQELSDVVRCGQVWLKLVRVGHVAVVIIRYGWFLLMGKQMPSGM